MPTCPYPAGAVVIAYARDSGGDEQDRSVDQQIAVYTDYCQAHQLTLLHIYPDKARPGSSTVGREQFDLMMRDLRKNDPHAPGAISGVLLWKLNRFARNLNDSQYHKADLRRRGYVLHFLADNIPQDDAIAPIFETLLEWKAQQDLHDISTDAKRGLASLVSAGYAPGTPPTCYKRAAVKLGLKRNGLPRIVSRWVRDPLTWARGKKAWAMRAAGHSFPSINRATKLFKNASTFSTFFNNPIYLGDYHFGDSVHKEFVEPLCTRAQWEAVQAQRQAPRAPSGLRHPRRVASRYLLSGLAHCAACGSPLVGSERKKWRYYICARKDRNARACRSSRLSAAQVEHTIVSDLSAHYLTPAHLLEIYTAHHHTHAARAAELRAERKALQAEYKKQTRAIEHLLDLAEQGDTSPALQARLAAREKDRAALTTRLAQLGAQLERHTPAPLPPLADFERLSKYLRLELASGDPARVKPIMQGCILRVTCDKKRGRVQYTLPRSLTGGMDSAPVGALSISPVLIRDIRWLKPVGHAHRLTARNAALYSDHYQHGLTLRELQNKYTLSEARVCQILQAIRRRAP